MVKSLGFGIRQACLPITPGGLLSSLGRVTLLLLASVSSSMEVITPLGFGFVLKILSEAGEKAQQRAGFKSQHPFGG